MANFNNWDLSPDSDFMKQYQHIARQERELEERIEKQKLLKKTMKAQEILKSKGEPAKITTWIF